MPCNPYVEQRLNGIRNQLMSAYQSNISMSNSTKGAERQEFIDMFLSEVFPKLFRFGTGDATDISGQKSGQLDVVIEFPFGPSLPSVGGTKTRLYLAETVAAVIEVKSNAASQWEEAIDTARQLYPLKRSYSLMMAMGELIFEKIPLFVVGYKGWRKINTIISKLGDSKEISGILIIDSGIFVSSKEFDSMRLTGDWALWGLIACIHKATGTLKAVSTNSLDYAKS